MSESLFILNDFLGPFPLRIFYGSMILDKIFGWSQDSLRKLHSRAGCPYTFTQYMICVFFQLIGWGKFVGSGDILN